MYWGNAIYSQWMGGLKWNLLKKLWKSSVSSNTLKFEKRVTPFLSEASNQASTSSSPAIVLFLKHKKWSGTMKFFLKILWRYYEYTTYEDNMKVRNLLQALTASFLVIDPLSSLSISLKIRSISSSLIWIFYLIICHNHCYLDMIIIW